MDFQFNYHHSWQLPTNFTPIRFRNQSYLVGLQVSPIETPYVQLILTNLTQYHVSIHQSKADLFQLFAFNDAFVSNETDLNEILQKLISVQQQQQSSTTDTFTLSLDLTLLTLNSTSDDFEFKFPLHSLTYEQQRNLDDKLKQKLIQFSFIQSNIVSELTSDLKNKNQIILKLASSIAEDYTGNSFKNDDEILNNKKVQGLFLQSSNLIKSLKSTPVNAGVKLEKDLIIKKVNTATALESIFSKDCLSSWELSNIINNNSIRLEQDEKLDYQRIPTDTNSNKFMRVESVSIPDPLNNNTDSITLHNQNNNLHQDQRQQKQQPVNGSKFGRKRRRKMNLDPTPIKVPRFE